MGDGRFVAAHPSRVAQAWEVATAEGIKRVKLDPEVPPEMFVLVDDDDGIDFGSFLPEDWCP